MEKKKVWQVQSIKDTLKAIEVKSSFQERFQHVKRNILADRSVQAFLERHSITEQEIENGLATLYEYVTQRNHCRNCPGLDRCPNMMKGYSPELIINDRAVDLQYRRCRLKIKEDEMRRQRELFESLYIPKEVLTARFNDLDIDPKRFEAIQTAEKYVREFIPGKTRHGLFFYGDFGVGKTYIMCAVANELAKVKNVKSLIVYTPDFFRELKNAIGDDSFHQKLNYIKTVPLLILDDIGAETISSWIRDEVLGAILQYRMMENLPTLYTSNYDYDELEQHLSYSEKAGVELLKAKRIMERIRHYTIQRYVGGQNRRDQFVNDVG